MGYMQRSWLFDVFFSSSSPLPLPHAVNGTTNRHPNTVNQEQLLNDFREAKGCTVAEAKDILRAFQGNVKDIRDPSRKSLLHIACAVMDFRVVKLLVEEYGLEIDDQDSSGNTPLHIACSSQKVQSVMYLVNNSLCDPNVRNNEGLTPLHAASRHGPMGLLKHLLSIKGLDTTVKDSSGRTAIEIIQSNPQLTPSLEKQTSTVSLMLPNGSGHEEKRRKGELVISSVIMWHAVTGRK